MFGFFENDPSKLLRKATAQKESGDIEGAITTLRQAYNAISKGQILYPIETFLRLPAYLQEAGHRDEAWRTYEKLLTDGYPHQLSTPDLIPMDHATIYDKMRLFLQREGSLIPAVAYGVLSHCSWAIGLYRQQRKAELRSHVTKSTI
jgi:tetratricopeptide (TPR) repeat protein